MFSRAFLIFGCGASETLISDKAQRYPSNIIYPVKASLISYKYKDRLSKYATTAPRDIMCTFVHKLSGNFVVALYFSSHFLYVEQFSVHRATYKLLCLYSHNHTLAMGEAIRDCRIQLVSRFSLLNMLAQYYIICF